MTTATTTTGERSEPASRTKRARATTATATAPTIALTEEQRAAVALGTGRGGCCLITGGPGHGKTAVLREIALSLRAQRRPAVFLAYTGSAADNVALALGQYADGSRPAVFTVDKLLATAAEVRARRGHEVVVDEASMLGLETFAALELALGAARYVLVGDPDQLPPVRRLCFFHYLVAGGQVPRALLTRPFRQGAGALLRNIARLRAAPTALRRADFDASDASFGFWDCALPPPPKRSSAFDERAAVAFLRSRAPDAPLPVFLCPSRETRRALNLALQRALNPAGAPVRVEVGDDPEADAWGEALRVGDPVMCTANTYVQQQLVVANGTPGRVASAARIEYANGFVDAAAGARKAFAAPCVCAYALTSHKAQGRGIPHVAVCLEWSRALTRPWFYTAVSRAMSSCVVLNGTEALLVCATQPVALPPSELAALPFARLLAEGALSLDDGTP